MNGIRTAPRTEPKKPNFRGRGSKLCFAMLISILVVNKFIQPRLDGALSRIQS